MRRGIEHLDFGVRNTLLYYKDLKTTLELTPGSGANESAVGRLLEAERVPLSQIFDTGPDALRGALKRVRSISYRARRDVDKGSPGTLCVAWGLATWDNGRAAVPASPVVLRQASVGRIASTAEDFDLGVSGPWILNVTLLRLLEVDFGVDIERDALSELAEELAGHSEPEALFDRMTKMAGAVPGFLIAPRVVLAPVPREAMVVPTDVTHGGPVTDATPVPATPVAVAPVPVGPVAAAETVAAPVAPVPPGPVERLSGRAGASSGDEVEPTTADTVALFRDGLLDPRALAVGSLQRRTVESFGPDAVVAEIVATLRGDSWPEALIEHADSGLRVRDRDELLQRWFEASPHRPRPSRWDATHFALWGLAAAPPAGDPSIRSVARWDERRHHPVLVAWQMVADHRSGGRRHGKHGRRSRLTPQRVTIPKGMDEALWGLPVDLLVEWSAWVFRQWPGAPIELLLPAGTPELLSAWYERARPVVELAVKTWVPFALVDDDLGKAAHRWVKQLTNACGGGGAPLATWFERSRDAATEAVAVRLGDGKVAGTGRSRTRGRATEHAI